MSTTPSTMDTAPPRRAPARALPALLVVAAAFAVIVLARWIALAWFAMDSPFWDQWDSEIALLYKPFVDGNLAPSTLFSLHNEHRIFFTRVLGLALFSANEFQFDNRAGALANAMLYAAVLCVFAWPLLARASTAARLVGGLLLAMFGIIPFGWENMLSGFQSAFSFLGGLAILAIGATVFGRSSRVHFVVVPALAVACLFTLASGVLLGPILAGTGFLLWRNRVWSQREFVPFAAIAVLVTLFGLRLIPHVVEHDALKAQSVVMFVVAAIRHLAWPLPGRAVYALLMWLPFAWALLTALRGRYAAASASKLDFYLIAIAGWAALQALAMAYSRGNGLPFVESRYADALALGPVCNLLLAWRLIGVVPPRYRASSSNLLFAGACIVYGALVTAGAEGIAKAADRSQLIARQQVNLRAYLGGGTKAALAALPPIEMSYPLVERLSRLLDDPTVRSILPASIRPPVAMRWSGCALLTPRGTWPTTTPAPWSGALGTFSPTIGNANTGTCTSEPFTTRFSHLEVTVAGYLGMPALSLGFVPATGGAEAVLPVRPDQLAREDWRRFGVSVTPGTLRMRADDRNPEFWFAFVPPVERGPLSVAIDRLFVALRGRPD